MQVYIYNADVYCEECGESIKKGLGRDFTGDSDDYPQGPTEQGYVDYPAHCGGCGVFLENQLTEEGYDYLREMLEEENEHNAEIHAEWREFYYKPLRLGAYGDPAFTEFEASNPNNGECPWLCRKRC